VNIQYAIKGIRQEEARWFLWNRNREL